MMVFDPIPLANELISARRTGETLPVASLSPPPSLAAALDVQARVFSATCDVVKGWKIALLNNGQAISAPLWPLWSHDESRRYPWCPGLGIEVEIAFLLTADLPEQPGQPLERDDIIRAIGGAFLGVELVHSRLSEGNAAPFPLFLADSLANAGYIIGAPLPLDIDALNRRYHLSVSSGQTIHFLSETQHPNDDPLTPLISFANQQSATLGGLKAGQIITTGSLCGVIPITAPTLLEVEFEHSSIMKLIFE